MPIKTLSDRRAWSHAWMRFWRVWALVATVGWVAVFFDDRIAQAVTGDEPDRHLKVTLLDFQDGNFRQIVEPTYGAEPLLAEWTASLFEPGEIFDRFVCGGGGNGSYTARIRPAVFSPDDWTGASCNLVQGRRYVAKAQWTWRTRSGRTESVASEFEFVYQVAS